GDEVLQGVAHTLHPVDDDHQFFFGVPLVQGDHRLTDPRPRRGGEVFDQAYRHFAAVIGVTGPLDKTTRFQAVDHTGDRARGQAEVVGDLSGRRRAQDTQQRAALEVGGVHPAVVRQPVQETEKTYGELPA